MENNILHIDMNNFYASCESIEHPEYRDIPLAVAGDSENRHGIILAKNQIAKGYGVKTAEVIWKAKQKCPGLTLVKPNFELYRECSLKAKEIYSQYTDRVESYGLDECWLDVGGSGLLFGDSVKIANDIRIRIKKELKLTVSVGVSFTKTFAKLGSDYKKPDAVTLFSKDNFKNTVWGIPAAEMLYVGPNTVKTLTKYGIFTIGDIARSDIRLLRNMLGKTGEMLYLMANGEEKAQVGLIGHADSAKSIGNSTTLSHDISSENDVRAAYLDLAETVARRLRAHNKRAGEIQISIRSKNFEDIQRQMRLDVPVCDTKSIYEAAMKLYLKENKKWEIRALGIRAGKLSDEEADQVSFFGDDSEIKKREKLDTVLDNIKEKFGESSIKKAVFYENENIQEEEYPGFSHD